MDFTELIRSKRDEFNSVREPDGIDAVLRHLDSAERHFQRGRLEGETDLFTDVVYRANQVFEGILKEAYEVLAEGSADKKSPYEIESFLEKNGVFSPRVIDYFTRYRQDWRNASIHDYRLDFNEQEAFLAISTVSAFCFVAIDQMVRDLASKGVSRAIEPSEKRLMLHDIGALAEEIIELLPKVMREIKVNPDVLTLSEVFLLGALDGLIQSFGNDINSSQEPLLVTEGRKFRPDLLLKQDKSVVIVELKKIRSDRISSTVEGPKMREQLAVYAHAAKATGALGIIFPEKLDARKDISFERIEVAGADVPTVILYPEVKSVK